MIKHETDSICELDIIRQQKYMDEVLKRIRISPTKLGILQMNNDQR
jgi:hypothetical protein